MDKLFNGLTNISCIVFIYYVFKLFLGSMKKTDENNKKDND